MRDNNSGLSVDGAVKRVMDLGGEQVPHLYFFSPEKGILLDPSLTPQMGFFIIILALGRPTVQ